MWPDKESNIDYLNFEYMVDLVADLATNKCLSPSTIGLYGDWGSGKSSLMKLAKVKIEKQNQSNSRSNKKNTLKSLCIEFNGWLFEGYEDAKSSLCGCILDALCDEKKFSQKVVDKARDLVNKIDFKKIVSKGVKYGIDLFLTGGIGAITDIALGNLINSLKDAAGNINAKQIEELIDGLKKDEKIRTEIKNFRKEFKELLDMSKIENLVIFIDELDRCQPDTILDIFEAIRLFLFVEGTSFIIGADERLIQYAIKSKYKEVPGNNLDIGKEYLEKVIQYPITIPQLTRGEVSQYLSCLLLEKTLNDTQFSEFLNIVHSLQPEEELSMELIIERSNTIAELCKDDMALSLQFHLFLLPVLMVIQDNVNAF